MASATMPSSSSMVNSFIHFLNHSPTPYHAVSYFVNLLKEASFVALDESQSWAGPSHALKRGGRYFIVRGGSTLVAFAVGQSYKMGSGAAIVGAHTDSPTLKLKPLVALSLPNATTSVASPSSHSSGANSKEKEGYGLANVCVYGGGLWYTWFDRDLGLAGRICTRSDALSSSSSSPISSHLVNIDRPILRIPSLAIHLDRSINTDGFKPNIETHTRPIYTTELSEDTLSALILREAGLDPSSNTLLSYDLNLVDVVPSTVGGLNREFILSGRLDNLFMSYVSLRALVESLATQPSENGIRMVALFDHEEIGSNTALGADSILLPSLLARIASSLALDAAQHGQSEESQPHAVSEIDLTSRMLRNSFMLSADCAHAVHPNYVEKYEESYRPRMNGGMVIKWNANMRYATGADGASKLYHLASSLNLPLQSFIVRNDSPCGSTIGPLASAQTGIQTVDIGLPILAMHSIREMGGAQDVNSGLALLTGFFTNSLLFIQ